MGSGMVLEDLVVVVVVGGGAAFRRDIKADR